MKLLITGGAGFIGSALVRYVLSTTDFSVVIVDKLTYAGNKESLPKEGGNPRLLIEQVDICDEMALAEVFKRHAPNAVMHLAAESHVDRSIESPTQFVVTNVMGTCVLLEQTRRYYNSLTADDRDSFRFHHISTDEVFGDLAGTSDLFVEDTPYAPSSPYSASKAGSDHLVRAWGRTFGLPVIITNCSNNYGPYQFPEKLIPHMIVSALKGRPLPVYGDGSQVRDWLFVDDHATALIKVLINGQLGETYNIGGHNEKKNIDVVKAICELLEELAPSKPKGVERYQDLITFVTDRPGHDSRYAINAAKIDRALGWRPTETFDTGLRKTVKWYLENEQWWMRVLSGEYRLGRIGVER